MRNTGSYLASFTFGPMGTLLNGSTHIEQTVPVAITLKVEPGSALLA